MNFKKFAKMSGKINEKKINGLYEFRLGSSVKKTVENMAKVYGADGPSERTVRNWFALFRSGDYSTDDKPRSGRPQAIDDDLVRQLVAEDARITQKEIASELGFAQSTVCEALKRLGIKYTSGKWMPHILSERNKCDRISKCASLLNRYQNCPFFDRLVTCDEKWIYYDNPSTRGAYVMPGERPPTKSKRALSNKKVLLCVFWDRQGIIYRHYMLSGKTIDSDSYCEMLDNLAARIAEDRPCLANRKGVLFHQDNAKPHTSKKTIRHLQQLGWELVEHPPYSPDLAPSDFYLFRCLQNHLDGQMLPGPEAAKKEVDDFFAFKQPSFFELGIQKLVERWSWVIANDGEYYPD